MKVFLAREQDISKGAGVRGRGLKYKKQMAAQALNAPQSCGQDAHKAVS